MAELDPGRWSAADDEVVRGALATLRRDVETLELADVRFVKARGAARRRRTLLTATAAGAAAVLVLGYLGFSGLRGNTASLQPAGPTHSTTSTGTPSGGTATSAPDDAGLPLPVAGELPVSAEWQRAFGITETVIVSDFKESGGGAVPDCANVGEPGTRSHAQDVHAESAGLQGDQRVYDNPSAGAGDRKADELVSQLLACSSGGPVASPKVSIVADSAWPKVFSAIGPASTAWYVVTHAGSKVGLVSVIEPGEGGKHRWTASQVQDIASVAQRRLQGGVGASTPAGPSSPTGRIPRNESMPVAGTRPLLPASLFVAASQWSSGAVSQGHTTQAVTTDWEGQAAIHDCDVDTAMDMTADAGRFGIVSVADRVDGTFLGKERVRLLPSADGARAEVDRLVEGIRSCAGRDSHMAVSPVDSRPGAFAFKLVRSDPQAKPVTTWVAVQVHAHTPQAVSTFVLRSPMADGGVELDRLLAMSLQK